MIVGVRMHADEVDIDTSLVQRLVAGQFPELADLPVEPVVSSGTDNAMYRLGDDLSVRLPRTPSVAQGVTVEQELARRVAPYLPVAVPAVVRQGTPTEDYPHPWAIYRWLAGANPATADDQLAEDLATFVAALRKIDPTGVRAARRGVPLAARDEPTREAIAASEGLIDTAAVTKIWDDALRIPPWSGAPTWMHGDLSPGNLLVQDGRLTAVIDWSIAGVGDPSVDLIVAWNLLSPQARRTYRAALAVDDDTWRRGRGWALSISMIQLPYYQHTNPVLAANSRHVISEILAEEVTGE